MVRAKKWRTATVGGLCGPNTSVKPYGGTGRALKAAGLACSGFGTNNTRAVWRDSRPGQEDEGYSVDRQFEGQVDWYAPLVGLFSAAHRSYE